MFRRELHLVFFHGNYFLCCAQWDGRCATQDLVPFGRFGAGGRILPSTTGGKDYSLSDPGFRGGAANAGYNPITVSEDGNFERRGGVEVLAEEEVAMVEGCSLDFDYEVIWIWIWGGDVTDREAKRCGC
jgi:hypothetical protein